MGLLQSPPHRSLGSACHGQLAARAFPRTDATVASATPTQAVVHADENRFSAQTSFAPTTNRIHPHGVARSPDRATGKESYGQRLPQGQETRASVEHA